MNVLSNVLGFDLMGWLQETLWVLPNYVWVIVGVVLLVLIIIIIVLSAKGSKKRKTISSDNSKPHADVSSEQSAVNYENYEGTYFTKQGAKLIVNDRIVWLVEIDGTTSSITSADNMAPLSSGEKVYVVRREVINSVVKVGDDYQQVQREDVKYLTINFVNKAEVRIGETVYQR